MFVVYTRLLLYCMLYIHYYQNVCIQYVCIPKYLNERVNHLDGFYEKSIFRKHKISLYLQEPLIKCKLYAYKYTTVLVYYCWCLLNLFCCYCCCLFIYSLYYSSVGIKCYVMFAYHGMNNAFKNISWQAGSLAIMF